MNKSYMQGPVLGKVVDNEDPDSLGRVKVVTDNFGEEMETDWIPVMTLFGGDGIYASTTTITSLSFRIF